MTVHSGDGRWMSCDVEGCDARVGPKIPEPVGAYALPANRLRATARHRGWRRVKRQVDNKRLERDLCPVHSGTLVGVLTSPRRVYDAHP